jgi:hypothetical protein
VIDNKRDKESIRYAFFFRGRRTTLTMRPASKTI